jgi:hypothetical protein
MALNDLHFSSDRPSPWLAGVSLVAAIALAILGLKHPDAMMLAILFGAIAVAFWATHPPGVDGSATDEGLELSRPAIFIGYDEVRRIETEINPYEPSPSYVIRVHHGNGVLIIPDAPDINSAGIHRALTLRYSASGSRRVNPLLEDYLERQLAMFGPERVWSYRAAPPRKNVHRPRRAPALALALLLTGIVWVVLNADMDGPAPWAGAGVLLGIVSALTLFILWFYGRKARLRRIKGWDSSGLVITPLGLAMIQGDVSGELEWDQLREVKLKKRPGYFQVVGDASTGLTGIILHVEGAMIIVADLYDRPIDMIHERILRYWKPERLGGEIES